MIQKLDAPESKAYLELFDQLWADKRRMEDVTEQVLERITTAYQKTAQSFFSFLHSIIFSMIFWRMSAKMTCLTKQMDLRIVWSGRRL